MKPSKLPWTVKKTVGEMEGEILDANGKPVCLMFKPGKHEWKPLQGAKQCEANADLIVKAVNHHHSLVTVIQKLIDELGPPIPDCGWEEAYDCVMQELERVLETKLKYGYGRTDT